MRKFVETFMVPLAIGISIVAFFWPVGFTWMGPHLALLLGIIMFGMGMTLQMDDFKRVAQHPTFLLAGIIAQYGIMPLLGYIIGKLLGLSPELIAGIVLLGACPGGTASNVMAYLAKANVGLSVSLTLLSTMLAPVLTPWLTWFYIHQTVQLDVVALMIKVSNIVLFPLLAGLSIRYFLDKFVQRFLAYFPLISATVIIAVIGCVVAINADKIQSLTGIILLAVVLHNAGGLTLGYGVGMLLTKDKATRRTLAIEVGMQNSGLASALALSLQSFGPLAALPGALFSVWHNITGATLASRLEPK
jgi:BASS family bile acid:Na+ symporter